MDLMDRKTEDSNWTFNLTGKARNVINLGSYNYLGFAENKGPCSDGAIQSTTEGIFKNLDNPCRKNKNKQKCKK